MGLSQFIELSTTPKTENSLISAAMRHWHSRHLHSKALVLSDNPEAFLKGAQKQWRRFIQQAQQERLHNTGADRILTLTYEITQMQHVNFTVSDPLQAPASHVWIIRPDQLDGELPSTCRSIYVATALRDGQVKQLVQSLPRYAVVTDYTNLHAWPLAPKSELEHKVDDAWAEVQAFLEKNSIDVGELVQSNISVDAIDNALDTLLDISSSFLRHAHHFQEVLALAEPISPDHTLRQQYDAVTLLARRVTLLAPTTFGRSFLQPSDDTFFMYDKSLHASQEETLQRSIKRHRDAGRQNIVFALERILLYLASLKHSGHMA